MKYILVIIALGTLFGGVVAYQITRDDSAENIPHSTATIVEEDTPAGEKPSQGGAAEPIEDTKTGDTGSIVISDLQDPDTEGFPVETNHYRIDESSENTYEVTLFAIINRPEQYQEYLDQLKQFKDEALQYMQQNGVNISEASITYIPNEANDL